MASSREEKERGWRRRWSDVLVAVGHGFQVREEGGFGESHGVYLIY